MQGRSWMAALTLTTSALLGWVLGFGAPLASRADDAKSTPAPAPATTPAPTTEDVPAASKVKLDLAIVGLGPKGCEVEIAPGNIGCRFRPVSLHLSHENGGKAMIMFEDVQISGADRYCIFAITIREPGQPVKTIRRGLRLVAASSERSSVQLLTCYLSSPSKLARASEMRERR
jgi:hypothetical protein